jgi:hypothetical protein
MTDQSLLERRYRRLLALYPRPFRREHEEEMLVVLLACARAGRRRPGAADSANLLFHAVWVRLRPITPRSVPSVFWAVRLMLLAAALELVAMGTVVASQGAVRSAVARHIPAVGVSHLAALVHGDVVSIEIGAPIAAAAWLLLAWANDRGFRWARAGAVALLALTSVSLLAGLGHHAAAYAVPDVLAGAGLWVVTLVATLLILAAGSNSRDGRIASGPGGHPSRRTRPRSAGWPAAGPDAATWN